jgi:hypothetical protein
VTKKQHICIDTAAARVPADCDYFLSASFTYVFKKKERRGWNRKEYVGHKNTKLHGVYFIFINSLLAQIYYKQYSSNSIISSKKKKKWLTSKT